MSHRGLGFALFVASSVGLPAGAWAGCPCPESLSGLSPRAGSSGVATNAKVTFYASRDGKGTDGAGAAFTVDSNFALDVRDGANKKVAGTTQRTEVAGQGRFFTFDTTPGLLPADSKLQVFAVDGAGKSYALGEITTGAAEDKTPPTFGGVDALEVSIDSYDPAPSCAPQNPINRIRAVAGDASDGTTAAADLRYELLFYRVGATPPTSPTVVHVGAAGSVELVLSTANCGLATLALAHGVSHCARVKVVDAAGNSAGGGVEKCSDIESRDLDVDGNPTSGGGGGCQVGGDRPMALALVGLLAVVACFALRRKPYISLHHRT